MAYIFFGLSFSSSAQAVEVKKDDVSTPDRFAQTIMKIDKGLISMPAIHSKAFCSAGSSATQDACMANVSLTTNLRDAVLNYNQKARNSSIKEFSASLSNLHTLQKSLWSRGKYGNIVLSAFIDTVIFWDLVERITVCPESELVELRRLFASYDPPYDEWRTVIGAIEEDSKLKIGVYPLPRETAKDIYIRASLQMESLQKKNALSPLTGKYLDFIQESSYEKFLLKLALIPDRVRLISYYHTLRLKAKRFPAIRLGGSEDANALSPLLKPEEESFFMKWVPLSLPDAHKEKDPRGRSLYTWKVFYFLFINVKRLKNSSADTLFYETA